MDITQLFIQIWGPVLALIGVGVFAAPKYYLMIYSDIKKEPLAAFMLGMFLTVLGTGHILLHSRWGSLEEVIVSLLGWALVAKGAVFLVAPDFAAAGGKFVSKQLSVAGIGFVLAVFGAYLVWAGYLG